jgi:heptosyltransferase-2
VLKLLLKTLGWTLAHTPEQMLQVLSAGLGDAIFFRFRTRQRLVLSNLQHAFPDRAPEWHRRIGRESCRRLIETGLLSLATPFLSETRLRAIVTASPELLAAHALHHADPAPTLICSPHLAYWEAQTSQALVVPGPFPEFGTIYRPLDNAAANEWVTRSRERFGIKLLSRKQGFAEALKILRRKGFVGVLFDQNAGQQGALTTLFGRVCSTTELPGLMAEKFAARVYGIFPRRRAFWRVEIGLHRVVSGSTTAEVTIALNRWLEQALSTDDNLCASWLWAHSRWRNQDLPAKRFRLEAKRDLLAADLQARGLSVLPRKTRIWIRLPNWLGDVIMLVPLLRALRLGRPDAEITVLGQPHFLPLIAEWALADRLLAVPPRTASYFRRFWRLRGEYPDVYLLLTNSTRGDLEAWLTGCSQRFGIKRPGRPRPLLTHVYRVPNGFDERNHHQLELWENLFRHFGLTGALDRTPLSLPSNARAAFAPIGVIAGSENTPEKRWPVAHWQALIAAFPEEHFVLFGTARDLPITSSIATGLDPRRVENLAGKTDLLTFARQLRTCRLLVTNDTGGMHLANGLGVPLIGLFGPTNPVRTGPIFSAPAQILQPPGCPPTGGGLLLELAPETVITAMKARLSAPGGRV